MNKEHRILLIGGLCTGKTTLSKELSKKLKIKVIHLDDHFWHGNWNNIGKKLLLENIVESIKEDQCWIIDGNYSIIRDNLWEKCTRIYYCYIGKFELIKRVFKRSFDKNRSGVPEQVRKNTNQKEPFFELFYKAIMYQIRKRKTDIAFCNLAKANGIDVVFIKCTHENIVKEINEFD